MSNYRLYNVDSNVYQGSSPKKPASNEIWVLFSGTSDPQFEEADNYNQDMWIFFDVSRILDKNDEGSTIILDLIPGAITPHPPDDAEAPFLIAIPYKDEVTEVQQTTISNAPENSYRLLIPKSSLNTIIEGFNTPVLISTLIRVTPPTNNNNDSTLLNLSDLMRNNSMNASVNSRDIQNRGNI